MAVGEVRTRLRGYGPLMPRMGLRIAARRNGAGGGRGTALDGASRKRGRRAWCATRPTRVEPVRLIQPMAASQSLPGEMSVTKERPRGTQHGMHCTRRMADWPAARA